MRDEQARSTEREENRQHPLFDEVVALHKAGRLREAEQSYCDIIAVDGAHFGAMHYLGFRITSSHMGRRRTKEALYQICQRAYFAVSQFSGPAGNRKPGREGADKNGPVADLRTNMFAKGDGFFDQLLTFKRSPIHPVRNQDQAGNTMRGDSHRVDDLERADGRLEVQSGRSAGDQHQV